MPKILVVDDEERIVDIMEKFLTINGFEVMKAIGGEAAVRILGSGAAIDVMVVDMKMPSVNGMDVIDKAKELGKSFPILLLTGSVDAEKYLHTLRDVGFTEKDILYKPVDLSILLDRIKEKLGDG